MSKGLPLHSKTAARNKVQVRHITLGRERFRYLPQAAMNF